MFYLNFPRIFPTRAKNIVVSHCFLWLNIVNDEKFALDLLKEKKILLVHGGGFNWHQPDHFRVVYLPRIEVLKEAAGKIRDFLEYYQQEI